MKIKQILIPIELFLMLIFTIMGALAIENSYNIKGNDFKEEKTKVIGLENAILKVRNNETSAHLEEVLAKIQTKQKEIFQKLQNLTVESKGKNTIAKGFKKDKFLGIFKIKHSYKYVILEDGTFTRQKKFIDNFFKEE